jgi:hypothetical protein
VIQIAHFIHVSIKKWLCVMDEFERDFKEETENQWDDSIND